MRFYFYKNSDRYSYKSKNICNAEWVKENKEKRFSDEMISFFSGLSCCDYAVTCVVNGKVIGFFRWDQDSDDKKIYSHGTFVEREYRRTRLAEKMWTKVVAKNKKTPFVLCVSSMAGLKFGKHLKETLFKGKRFEIEIREYSKELEEELDKILAEA